MAKIISGKEISAVIKEELKEKVKKSNFLELLGSIFSNIL